MEDHLRDAVEIVSDDDAESRSDDEAESPQDENSAELRLHRTKLRVTFLVVILTALTAAASALGAWAEGHAVTTERSQQSEALASKNAQSAWYAAHNASDAASIEAARSVYRAEASLAIAAPGSNMWENSAQGEDNAAATAVEPVPQQYGKYQQHFESSRINGVAAYDWRRKQQSFIGVAALGAMGLFLLGLVLTIPHRRVRFVLLVAGGAIALAGATWLTAALTSPVARVDKGTLSHYVKGMQALEVDSHQQQAITQLQTVVHDRPNTPEAWYALATAVDGSDLQPATLPTGKQLHDAIHDYRRSLAGGGSVINPFAWNNLAFDELRVGALTAASHDVQQALKHYDGNQLTRAYAQGTEAEILLRRGQLRDALDHLYVAVQTLQGAARGDTATIEVWFDSLRDDWRYFAKRNRPNASLNEFYMYAIEYEAVLEGSSAQAPSVAPIVSNLDVRYVAAPLAPTTNALPTGVLQVSFDYTHFDGSLFSMRTYDISGDEYDPQLGASVLLSDHWTWGSGTGHWTRPWPVTVVPGHNYLVEVFWGHQLLASDCLQANGARLSSATGCDPLT